MISLSDLIINDIFDEGRQFLPGERCTREDVLNHFEYPILIDGLTSEESALILSTLPKNSDRIFLSPLDKGLSGSKVFAARYSSKDGRPSKLYVFKLGLLSKLLREKNAIQNFAAPYIPGIAEPISRRGEEKGLVVQELVGLSVSSQLTSLRFFARNYSKADQVLRRLFNERLASWYLHQGHDTKSNFLLRGLFEWYLQKNSAGLNFPSNWIELRNWVRTQTGYNWRKVPDIIENLLDQSIQTVSCIIHGDLHSQNILIDERLECWPIDFAWCHDKSSPVLDLVMLECSLKFLSIPRRCALRTLFDIEKALCEEPLPSIRLSKVPYREEIQNVLRAIGETRRFALETLGIEFKAYRKALCLMTYTLSGHPSLNRPFVLGSLQVLAAIENSSL
jgi:hypothetical protein